MFEIGEGWETRRRREPGCDWCIVELAVPGEIGKIDVDTAHQAVVFTFRE